MTLSPGAWHRPTFQNSRSTRRERRNQPANQSVSSSSPRIGDTRPAPQIGDTRPGTATPHVAERRPGGAQSTPTRRSRSRWPGRPDQPRWPGGQQRSQNQTRNVDAPVEASAPEARCLRERGGARQGPPTSRRRTPDPRAGPLPHVRAHHQRGHAHRHPRRPFNGRVHGGQGRGRDQPDRRQHLRRSNPERVAGYGTRLRGHRDPQERRALSR